MDSPRQISPADLPQKAEKGVTVNIVVHNPAHMKYMSKIGIYLLYYCKECPYNSQALLDVTTHVAADHEMEGVIPETTPPATVEPVIEVPKPKRQEHNYSTKTESKGKVEPQEPSMPVVVFPKLDHTASSTNVMSKVKVPKLKKFSPAPKEEMEEQIVNTNSEAMEIEPEDFSFVPRDFFCSRCPYTVMYSATEMEQHRLCHGDDRQTPSQNDDSGSISQDSGELSCYMCRPGRGKNVVARAVGMERSKGQVWHHLKEHLYQRHNIDYQIRCKLCDLVFKSHLTFKTHRATHLIKCRHSFCKFATVSVTDMTTHQKCHVVGQEKKFKCFVCGHYCKRDPGKWSVMHAHLVACHKDLIKPLYQCHRCPKGFQCLRQYRIHLRSCRKVGNLLCSICNEEIHPDVLSGHLKMHTKYEEKAANPDRNTEHLKHSVDVSDVACSAEGEEMSTILPSGSVDDESETPQPNPNPTLYLCSVHDIVFPTKEAFTEHVTTSHTSTEVAEDGNGVNSDGVVTEHFLVSEKPISYFSSKCKICYKKFQSEQRLLRHVSRVHTKDGDLVPCTICGRQFKNKIRLRNHVREVHEGLKRRKVVQVNREKPLQYHICETCGYTTPSTLRLRNHQLSVHQGIIPYQCDKCDFKTSEKSDFYRHKWRHSGTKKYSCTSCSYKTNTRWVMVNHAWKQHGVQLPKKSKDTMGCIWSKRWQDKLRRMATISVPVPQNTGGKVDQQETLYLPSEILNKDDEQVNIPESYLQNIKIEDQVVDEELVSQDNVVCQEIISDGSVSFDPTNLDVREVIVDPSAELSELGDNVVYIPDTDLTEATEAALLLLAVGPNQTITAD